MLHADHATEATSPVNGRRCDDEEAAGRFVVGVLRTHGFNISHTVSPRTAAALLRIEAISLDWLITDYRMTDMSETELMAATPAIKAELSAIICTDYAKTLNTQILRQMDAAPFQPNR